MFIDVDEIAELRKKVQLLTEENKRLKYKVESLLEDSTGNSLYQLKHIIANYCESLGEDALIVINQDSKHEYKLGVSLTGCTVKDLKDWNQAGYQCSSLKSFEDSTKVLLLS